MSDAALTPRAQVGTTTVKRTSSVPVGVRKRVERVHRNGVSRRRDEAEMAGAEARGP